MNTFMSWVWFLAESAIWGLPWAMMTAMAGWAFAHKKIKPLALQAVGGLFYFVLMPLRWGVMWILWKMSTPDGAYNAVSTIFSFLQWITLAVFVVGYCWEKWQLYRNEKVAAFPVEVAGK